VLPLNTLFVAIARLVGNTPEKLALYPDASWIVSKAGRLTARTDRLATLSPGLMV
jgi:hypothetical protein